MVILVAVKPKCKLMFRTGGWYRWINTDSVRGPYFWNKAKCEGLSDLKVSGGIFSLCKVWGGKLFGVRWAWWSWLQHFRAQAFASTDFSLPSKSQSLLASWGCLWETPPSPKSTYFIESSSPAERAGLYWGKQLPAASVFPLSKLKELDFQDCLEGIFVLLSSEVDWESQPERTLEQQSIQVL